MNSEYELSWDLDGVCANYDLHFKNLFGKLPHQVSDDQMWKMIETKPQFYLDIPPYEDMVKLVQTLRPIVKSRVITGRPRRDTMPTASEDKQNWCKRYFDDIEVVVCLARDKQKYITPNKINILVDDRKDNINRWNAAGGVGILHKSYADTKQTLDKFFSR